METRLHLCLGYCRVWLHCMLPRWHARSKRASNQPARQIALANVAISCNRSQACWPVKCVLLIACWPKLFFFLLHAGCDKADNVLLACRAPPQQASFPSTAAAGFVQSSDLAASANKGVPNQAALGTAGRPHQPSSSAAALGAPPGLGHPQQARRGGMGVQQAGITDGAMNGQSTQVKLVHVALCCCLYLHLNTCN